MAETEEEKTCSGCGELEDECTCGQDSSCDNEELGKENDDDVHGRIQNEAC